MLYVDTINYERYVRYSATGPEIFTLQCYCSLTIGAADEVRKMATHEVCIAERLCPGTATQYPPCITSDVYIKHL